MTVDLSKWIQGPGLPLTHKDVDIARLLEVPYRRVQKERVLQGYPKRVQPPFDLSPWFVGEGLPLSLSDAAIARIVDVPTATVAYARRKADHPVDPDRKRSWAPRPRRTPPPFDLSPWFVGDGLPLSLSDIAIARKAEIPKGRVAKARKEAGHPNFKLLPVLDLSEWASGPGLPLTCSDSGIARLLKTKDTHVKRERERQGYLSKRCRSDVLIAQDSKTTEAQLLKIREKSESQRIKPLKFQPLDWIKAAHKLKPRKKET